MHPEDQKNDFKQPQETTYFSAAASADATVPDVTPGNEPQPDVPAPQPLEGSEEVASAPSTDHSPEHEPVHWQSAEYHHSHKSMVWFIAFGFIAVALVVAAVLLLQSWTFAVLVVVMAVALGLYAQRPPRTMDYTLSEKGLYINDTLHHFGEFKAFGVIHDGNDYSVTLIPVRRFSPEVTVYFPEPSGEMIVDVLGVRLPMQPIKFNVFDRITRFLGI